MTGRGVIARARRGAGAVAREASTEIDCVRFSRRGAADVALFHEFAPPPTGGGHQFLRALVSELQRRGLTVEVNRISAGTRACLFNSFNFDFRRLRRFSRGDVRFVHRVDGPIATYRGFDDGTDARITEINRELADVTIVQSRYSRDAHLALGIELVEPRLISNAADPSIFHAPAEREPLAGRRVRVIATSWSDNLNKGAEVIAWLDRHLDHDRYELTFAGRTDQTFEHVRVLGPIASEPLAAELRRSDVYLAPSRNDPCSNALLEALASGLPAVFRASGGHPELVGDAGVAFDEPEEVVRSTRPPRLRARRAPCGDPGGTARRGCGSLPRGASRVTARSLLAPLARGYVAREGARVAESLTPLRRRRANDLVRGRGRATSRSDRAAARVRRRSLQVGTVRDRPGGLPHEPLRGFATPLDAVDAPPCHGVSPRKARDARVPGVRRRVRRSPLGAGSLRSDPGDARGDARPRARGGRRAERGARDRDRNRHRAFPTRHVGEPHRSPCRARPARGRLRGRLVPEGRRRLGRRPRAEAREGAGHSRRGTRADRG